MTALVGIELRRHELLLESEQGAVEGAGDVRAVVRNRDGDVLEPHAPMAA